MSLSLGCQSIRLPAIDPSGERIFSRTTTTTLESCTPKPAFVAPPKPPPCAATELGATAPVAMAPQAACPPPAALAATPAACGPNDPSAPGGVNQLKLTPSRVVAPVGTDVVLLAGYCGADGHFIMRQPVEWMMSPDSVGMIVEVGDVGADCVQRWRQEYPKKLTGDFAVGYTSYKPQVITRGTPMPQDDVRVAKGQTWISVTSPTEGTSHVTVWAPRAPGWDRRRQTASIHWIDAQWAFPGPAVARAGESSILTTTVSRSSNSTPHVGWLVRYAVEGLDVRFANNDTQIEVPTDAEGKAAVEILPPASGGGTARVTIEVIRPVSDQSPRMTVGTGETTVTWSAPGLSMQVLGPDTIPLGTTGVFRIVVTNQGELPTRDVVVTDAPPPSLKYVTSSPQGQWFGDHLEWRLGDLPARGQRILDVTFQAIRPGDIRYCARAQSADGLSAENCLDRARIYAPALAINMSGPSQVPVGAEAQFRIEVTNQSSTPLTNVQLMDRFDEGLAHIQGERSPLQWNVGTMAAGETKRVALTFIARQPGQLCHVIDATADGGHTATAQGCVVATAPPPGTVPGGNAPLRVQISGAGRQQVGQAVDYTISIYNAGAAPLSNVRLVYQFSPSLQPIEASAGFNAARGQLVWDVPQLARDERRSFVVRANCLQPDPAALNRVTVSADQSASQSAELATEITPPGAAGPPPADSTTPPPPPNLPPGGANAPGELTASIAELADPVKVGQMITYILRIQNDRDVADQNVTLALELPPGVDFTRVKISNFRARGLAADGRTLEMEPIAELRAREALRPCRIEIPATQPGKLQVRAIVRSVLQPAGVTIVEETTVTAD
ncbi:MAG: hypothetical protein U1A77_20225 [Pirellulales bacterium]